MDGFHLSSYFLVLESLYQSFGYCTESTNYNWYNHHFHIPQFFQIPSKVQVVSLLFTFNCTLWSTGTANSIILQVLFLCWLLQGLVVWPRLNDPLVSQKRSFYISFSRTNTRFSIYYLFVWSNLNFLENSQGLTVPTQSCLV